MTDSIRLQCLQTIQANLKAMTAPDYSYTFTDVVLGPISLSEARKRCFAGIVPGKEEVTDLFPLSECILPVTIEFRISHDAGDPNPQTLGERLLENIQRKMKEDIYLSGLAMDLRETSNEIVLGLFDDKSVDGWVAYTLMYRHNTGDPRSPV